MDNEQKMIKIVNEIEEKYINKSILDIDVLGLKYTSKANQQLELGFTIKELSDKQNKEIEFTRIVSLREWIFGMLCSCADLVNYEDEIDSLFVKRMSEVSTELIYKHKEWDIYAQTGQHMTAAVKLSTVLQHDIENIITDDISRLLEYHLALNMGRTLDLSIFKIKWGTDVIELFRKMDKELSKISKASHTAFIQSLVINSLFKLVKTKKSDIVPDLYKNIFFFGLSDLLKEMSADILIVTGREFLCCTDTFFKKEDFLKNLDTQGVNLYDYIYNSSNYIKRVIRKGRLEEYGTYGEEAFFSGASLNAYLPLGTHRSDYQFILYFIVNQALNAYNKIPKSHFDTGEKDKAKENMLKSYMLGKRFNFEGKELHNFAITVNIIFNLVDEMNRMSKLHLCEVVNEVVVLKTTYNKLSRLLSDTSHQLENLQLDMEKELLSRDTVLLEEKSKLYKDIYKDLRKELNNEIDNYKKENDLLKKNLETVTNTQEAECATTIDDTQEIPTVKYASDLNILVIGDYNLKTTLLENVFSSVKKIDGNNSANLNMDSAVAGVDLIAYQYTFCQHESMRFTKEAAKRGIPVAYFKHVNEKKILDEIYGYIYK